jgi:hypothetical protein
MGKGPHQRSDCHEKQRLLTNVIDSHKRIAALHDQEVQAVINGDFRTDVLVTKELEKQRAGVRAAMDELREHVASHRC